MKYLIKDVLRLICSFIYHFLWLLFFIAVVGIAAICLLHYIGRGEMLSLETREVVVAVVAFVVWIVLIRVFGCWKDAFQTQVFHYLSMLSLQELIGLLGNGIDIEDKQRIYKHGIGYRSLNGYSLVTPDEVNDATYFRFQTIDGHNVLVTKSSVENEGKIIKAIEKIIAERADTLSTAP